MLTTDAKLATALAALKTIATGSGPTGRWIDQIDDTSIDDANNKDSVPEGCYDTENEPQQDPIRGDDTDTPNYPEDVEEESDQERLILVGGKWLRPATWEEYTDEEQSSWLETVTATASAAVAAIEA